jgi:hypothetical protein
MKKLIVCVVIGVVFGMGCNRHRRADSPDPLTVLASPQAATNYDYPFWNDQFQRKTDAWQRTWNEFWLRTRTVIRRDQFALRQAP